MQGSSLAKNSMRQNDLLIVLGIAGLAAVLKAVDDTQDAEPFAEREPPVSCDPTPKAGVIQFRNYVVNRFGGLKGWITRPCEKGSASHHHEGRAWDWMGVAPGDENVSSFFSWLLSNEAEMFRRAGLQYVIWNRKIFTSSNPQWVEYRGADPHTNHVHVSFSWSGANAKTSFYQ